MVGVAGCQEGVVETKEETDKVVAVDDKDEETEDPTATTVSFVGPGAWSLDHKGGATCEPCPCPM